MVEKFPKVITVILQGLKKKILNTVIRQEPSYSHIKVEGTISNSEILEAVMQRKPLSTMEQ